MKHERGNPTKDWISLALAAITLLCGGMAAAFTTFETKDIAKERSSQLESRLDRIERKLDALLERAGKADN